MITREQLETEYLDWLNNYLTVEIFCEHRGLTLAEGEQYLAFLKTVALGTHPDK